MTTNYFYFFSTIAQTLAAIMAFLGVFVVFRLQALGNFLSQLETEIDERTSTKFHYSFFGGMKLFEIVEKILKDHETQPDHASAIQEIRGLISKHHRVEEMKAHIVTDFFGVTIAAMVVIGVSILGIVLVPNPQADQMLIKEIFSCECFLIPWLMVWSFIFMKGALGDERKAVMTK